MTAALLVLAVALTIHAYMVRKADRAEEARHVEVLEAIKDAESARAADLNKAARWQD